ncbi:MAG: hypothetical protein Q9170_002744 [Blastenia crenularia]
MKKMYKQQRQNDDRNQPLSVQPWGNDGDKRRYWLIEGRDDTPFRLYRESNPALKNVSWRSIAGSIEELEQVATKLDEDGSQASRKLRDSIYAAIPRFEAGEDKRKRREYRMSRKAQFTRVDPGFSLYEGRTRGKRIKYTFSEEEDGGSDALSTRRSNRQSSLSTPAEPARPTVTASGRQVRSRYGGAYGETLSSTQQNNEKAPSNGGFDGTEDDEEVHAPALQSGRATRNGGRRGQRHAEDSDSTDGMNDDSEATSSGHEWDGGDDDEADEHADDGEDEDDEVMNEEASEDELAISEGARLQRSLVISLRYPKPTSPALSAMAVASEENNQTQEPNGLSDQAPPPEANPFAIPSKPDIPVQGFSDGFSSSVSEGIMDIAQDQTLHQEPPAIK